MRRRSSLSCRLVSRRGKSVRSSASRATRSRPTARTCTASSARPAGAKRSRAAANSACSDLSARSGSPGVSPIGVKTAHPAWSDPRLNELSVSTDAARPNSHRGSLPRRCRRAPGRGSPASHENTPVREDAGSSALRSVDRAGYPRAGGDTPALFSQGSRSAYPSRGAR